MSHLTKRYRRLLVPLFESVVFFAAITFAFLLRFEYSIPEDIVPILATAIVITVPAKLIVFRATGASQRSWRYISVYDLFNLLFTCVLASAVAGSLFFATSGPRFPRSIYVLDLLLTLLFSAGIRVAIRLYFENLTADPDRRVRERVLIYGAGHEGRILLHELCSNRALRYQVMGFLEDASTSDALSINGVTILGSGRDLPDILSRFRSKRQPIDQVIITMPEASGRQIQDAVANCRSAGVALKILPSVDQLLKGQVLLNQIRNVVVEDLLGREPVHLEERSVRESIRDRSILVTGGAGSIGSELCRQMTGFLPRKVVVFDMAESDLFHIHNDLLAIASPETAIIPEIGDIRQYSRVEEVIRKHAIDSVFHAAAYKHVPLMEAHLVEAVSNNVLGTWNVARASSENGVRNFILISTDKAVNPVSVMGATKRAAELIASSFPDMVGDHELKCTFVRFGNVLASQGSVVELFRRQIERGGPVTVTHPDMTRFFMTIPEAVQLVLQASAMGTQDRGFVLDMGKPVRIVDLARNMIRFSGQGAPAEPEIRYVGLRPGEKLTEQLAAPGEETRPTQHEKVKSIHGRRVSYHVISAWISPLEQACRRRDEGDVIRMLKELVVEYSPEGRLAGLLGVEPWAPPAPRRTFTATSVAG